MISILVAIYLMGFGFFGGTLYMNTHVLAYGFDEPLWLLMLMVIFWPLSIIYAFAEEAYLSYHRSKDLKAYNEKWDKENDSRSKSR